MQRWPRRELPVNLSPIGTRCIQIIIPDDDDWERAMYAEVVTLAQWMRWERDLGKNGKPVADIWLQAIKTWKHCDGTPAKAIAGLLEDFEMPLRVDCDCNVFITCCDGTEKQILTSEQVSALINQQPGGGTPVPVPGACEGYNIRLQSGGTWLLPGLVNTGDVLTLSALDGATTDAAPIGRWNCPDGGQFALGECQGFPITDPGSLLPSAAIGRLVWNINGTYYDAVPSLTVPGGVANKIAALQVNYPPGGDYAGDVTAALQHCNNQPPTWEYTFDFLAQSGAPFVQLSPIIGTWQPGVGWLQGGSGGNTGVEMQINIPLTNFTDVILHCFGTGTNDTSASSGIDHNPGSGFVSDLIQTVVDGDQIFQVHGTFSAISWLFILTSYVGGAAVNFKVTSITFKGTGVNPFV